MSHGAVDKTGLGSGKRKSGAFAAVRIISRENAVARGGFFADIAMRVRRAVDIGAKLWYTLVNEAK